MKDDYAFIEYASTTSAARALTELNGGRICGSKVVVEEAKPKEGATVVHDTTKSITTHIIFTFVLASKQ